MSARIVAALVLLAGVAHAEPVTLRMAAIAPDGTEWARALKAFAQEVETQSKGELRMKWYLGGMAGDELTALDRIKRGQLDGEAPKYHLICTGLVRVERRPRGRRPDLAGPGRAVGRPTTCEGHRDRRRDRSNSERSESRKTRYRECARVIDVPIDSRRANR